MERVWTWIALVLVGCTALLSGVILANGILTPAPQATLVTPAEHPDPPGRGVSASHRETSSLKWDLPMVYVGNDAPTLLNRSVGTNHWNNTTGLLLEVQWTSSKPHVGDGVLVFEARVGDVVINSTVERDARGVQTLRILPEQYKEGALWARVRAPTGFPTPNVLVVDHVNVYLTRFSGGPPDWSFTAVPG